MKKLIFFSLALVTFISCKKVEEPCPHDITCRIYEKDSNIPVPFGRVNFYRNIFQILYPFELVQGYTANAEGYFTVPSDLDCDFGNAIPTEFGQFAETGWNDVTFDSQAETMNFYISCFSNIRLSTYDDPNINNGTPVYVKFTTTNPFFPPYFETTVNTQESDSLVVKSYFPSQLITFAYYSSGNAITDTVDIPSMSSGEEFIFSYPY